MTLGRGIYSASSALSIIADVDANCGELSRHYKIHNRVASLLCHSNLLNLVLKYNICYFIKYIKEMRF